MSLLDDEQEAPCLVTNYSFDRKDYLIKMYVKSNALKLTIVDNVTSEKWVCSYNAMYIEELTRRTGNYKKFNVFVSMLNSGILKTSPSVRIELMSHQHLEALTYKYKYDEDYKIASSKDEDSRMYLILVYTVEFDKIHYPLPLEYCGMPNPRVLQKKIQDLEREKSRLEEELSSTVCIKCTNELPALKEKVMKLEEEKKALQHEVQCLAAELGSRNIYSRFPVRVRSPSPNREYYQERMKPFQQDNLRLVQTDKQSVKESNKRARYRQPRRCRKCSDPSADVINHNHLNNESSRKLPSPMCSPVRKKPSDVSATSSASVSSGKSSSVKGKGGVVGRSRMNKKRVDKNASSSSGFEHEDRKARRNPKMRALAVVVADRKARAANDQHLLTPSQDKSHQKYIPTEEQLRKQINDLVRLVESWSNDFSALPNQQHT